MCLVNGWMCKLNYSKLADKIIEIMKAKQNEKDEYGHYKILPSLDETKTDLINLIDTYVKLKRETGND